MVNELFTKQTGQILGDTMIERTTLSPIARLLSTIKEWACALAFPAALIGGALFVITMHASRAPL